MVEDYKVADEGKKYNVKETIKSEKIGKEIIELTEKMFELAEQLKFEDAARVRDRIRELERKI